MNWLKREWSNEDKRFSPKRKINNKQSKFINHLSGYLRSEKMKRDVGYESLWGECLFYYLLELDPETIRYYEQPVEVPITALNEQYELNTWIHVPDVLVFRQGNAPILYQIKGSEYTEIEINHINKACCVYAEKQGWTYNVIFPRELPEVIKSNIIFLYNFLKPRKYYMNLMPEVLHKMSNMQESTVIELSQSFSAKTDYRFVLPLIYHLIAKGTLNTDLSKPIKETSIVTIGSTLEQIHTFFQLEGNS